MSGVKKCVHPLSCQFCQPHGFPCGRHAAGDAGHERCVGSDFKFQAVAAGPDGQPVFIGPALKSVLALENLAVKFGVDATIVVAGNGTIVKKVTL